MEDWLKKVEEEKRQDCLLFKMNIPELKKVSMKLIEQLYSSYSHETACAGWLTVDYQDPKRSVFDFAEWATKSPLQLLLEDQEVKNEDSIA